MSKVETDIFTTLTHHVAWVAFALLFAMFSGLLVSACYWTFRASPLSRIFHRSRGSGTPSSARSDDSVESDDARMSEEGRNGSYAADDATTRVAKTKKPTREGDCDRNDSDDDDGLPSYNEACGLDRPRSVLLA